MQNDLAVRSSNSGESAVEMMEKDQFDVVLLDKRQGAKPSRSRRCKSERTIPGQTKMLATPDGWISQYSKSS
jgi:hypothetical protein